MIHDTRWLVDALTRFVRESPLNRLTHLDGSPIYDAPLIGLADGDDPLFSEYKAIIGDYHLTPREVLGDASTAVEAPTEHPTVVCWILPIARSTRELNRDASDGPSERWAHTRTYGEEFNNALRRHVEGLLSEAGYLAVAPMLAPGYRSVRDTHVAPSRAQSSTWSERHAAYAAGLGTFSLNDGLITPRGIAHRCGSVVTSLALPATPRPYVHHTANCLYLAEGTCGECIARCPVGAITAAGHDKVACGKFVYNSPSANRLKSEYHVRTPGCGLCQTGVPCEDCIPASRRVGGT